MVIRDLIKYVQMNAAELITSATVASTIILVLRVLTVSNWNFDIALLLLSHMNIFSELILTGALVAFILISTSFGIIFYSHELGEKIPRVSKVMGTIVSLVVLWLPLGLAALYIGAMISRIILNYFAKKSRFRAKEITKYIKSNTLSLSASLLAGLWLLALPNFLLVPGTVTKVDSSKVGGLILTGNSQLLILAEDRNSIDYVPVGDVINITPTMQSDAVWMKSIYSHLIELAP